MLNKGKLVELKGLVISELPGHYSEVRTLGPSFRNQVKSCNVVSFYFITTDPNGNKTSQTLAAKRRHRDSQRAMCFGSPVFALKL